MLVSTSVNCWAKKLSQSVSLSIEENGAIEAYISRTANSGFFSFHCSIIFLQTSVACFRFLLKHHICAASKAFCGNASERD